MFLGIKAVLFDLDGTLLDRESSLISFVSHQYDRYRHFQAVPKETFLRRFIELDHHGYVWKDKVYQQLLEEFSITELSWSELLDDYLHGFQEHCIGFPNLLSMLTELKANGMKLALVSNGYGQFQYDNFQALGISAMFDEVLISEWEGLRKPDPAIFLRALSKLGVKAEEALFVGDHPDNDIHASRAVGLRTAWKRNAQFTHEAEADVTFEDLKELVECCCGRN